jgi:DUF2958 family protein
MRRAAPATARDDRRRDSMTRRRLLLPAERKQMLDNGNACAGKSAIERLLVVPVVRLYFASGTWILSELYPLADDWIAYGLVAIPRQDTPVVFGAVSLDMLERLRGVMGRRVQRDEYFKPREPLSYFAHLMNYSDFPRSRA